jgi:hypothetical protein
VTKLPSRTDDDGVVAGGLNSGSDETNSSAAHPAVYPDSADATASDSARSFTLDVDGELFEVRPDAWGGTSYTWLTGPNEGYGFSESPTTDRSLDEHRKSIRNFLTQIDPATGYIE